MAKKKVAKKAKSTAKKAKSTSKKKSTLGGFFRTLYSKRTLMEKFSSGPEGRQAVLEQSNLTSAHQKLIAKGCVPEIIHALAGGTGALGENSVVVDCNDEVTCSHASCKAFSAATKQS